MNQESKDNILTYPNLLASLMCMFEFAYYANILFFVGFIPFIWRNYKQNDRVQMKYFIKLWLMAIGGIVIHLIGWNLSEIFKELI